MSGTYSSKAETQRLHALRALQLLDTPAEEIFDRLTRLAARLLQVPAALITLIDHERQWIKSAHGMPLQQTAREHSFCTHTIAEPSGILHISDARRDARFCDNPLVTAGPQLRFYAGVALHSTEKHRLGALCVVDQVQRDLSEAELAILRDIAHTTEQLLHHREQTLGSHQRLHSLEQREQRYRQLIEQLPDAMLILREGTLEFANQAGLQLLGASEASELLGQPFESLVAPEFRERIRERLRADRSRGEPATQEQQWLRLDGNRVDVETTEIAFASGNLPYLQIIARDITEYKRQRQELERLATHDALTGLPNRSVLRDALERGIARWQRQRQQAIVAFVDLDNFKTINDTLGHGAGDQMLSFVARQLRTCLRSSDTVARIGGDEFALILDDVDSDEPPAQTLNRLLAAVSQPLWLGGQEVLISCSIGYCCYPQHGSDPETLLNAADLAMYRAKALGRANAQAYTPEMALQTRERLSMESQLRRALEHDEFILHYQPKIDLRSGHIVGAEALLRWQHPQQGLLRPAHFIPVAEECGLIIAIGEWVLAQACAQIRHWQQYEGISLPVAVNLSSRQFLQRDITRLVATILDSLRIEPGLLELEMTESMPMGKPEHSIAIMQEFRRLGVSLSIDDFGTGYSNLSYLKRFPLDKIKIDQSFIQEITRSPEALAIAQAIIAIAHSLQLRVVAEGVETETQRTLLMVNHCDEIQGYFFSKPLSAADCTALLRQHRLQTMSA